ncbi:MAG: DUF3455 domain-containing protein [Pseudomonadota bacterium]|nr:DUF3455 domain-containing protein [Pseudomonadota bacterium]
MKFGSCARMLGKANDGSRFIGDMLASGQIPMLKAIPWLQRRVKVTVCHGAFSNGNYLQRLNSVLGSAPAVGCPQDQPGQQLRASYWADYFFYAVER